MDAGKDDGSFGEIQNALGSAPWIGQVPWLHWAHDFLMPTLGNYLGVTARNGSLREFAAREAAARRSRGSDRKDILSKLFEIQKERPDEFDDAAVISMANSNIFAGSDTTAIATRAVICYLLKNPECKKRFVEEIDKMRRNEHVGDIVTIEQSQRMPHLQACMYETLRCFAPVGFTIPRIVPVRRNIH